MMENNLNTRGGWLLINLCPIIIKNIDDLPFALDDKIAKKILK